MAVSITVCNLALGELRAPPIVAIDEESLEARECARYYPHCLSVMLEKHLWTGANRIAPLTQLATNNRDGEWAYAYALPTDIATAKRIVPNYAGIVSIPVYDPQPAYDRPYWQWPYDVNRAQTWGERFLIEAGVLYSNLSDAHLEYSANEIDEAVMTPMFQDALAYYLAARLAVPIRDSRDLKADLLKQAEVALQRAVAVDMNRQPNFETVEDVGQARGYGV